VRVDGDQSPTREKTTTIKPKDLVWRTGGGVFYFPLSHIFAHCLFPSPRAMATKQEHDGDKPVAQSPYALRTLLSSAITTYDSAEVALIHIMKTHDFDTSLLQEIF
jgi:hypothetical protein